MNVQGKEEERPKLERFDGTQPATYRKWRRKAELMLLALPTTYSKDRWGAKLMEFLSGEAEEVCEGIALEKIIKEGGHEIIFETLDGRYKDLQKDALQKHLTEYFYGTSIKAGESYRNMTIRLETAYRRLQEHKVELPDEVRGWFLLRKLQLESQAEAMVLTHTRGSLKYADVNSAAQAIFPQGCAKTGGGKSREVFETELLEEPGKTNQETDELDGDDVFQVIADQIQSQETYDDEEAIEVFESYQDIRRKMQQKKMARGYKATGTGSTWTLSGTVRGKIEQLKARSRCHICQERGHWKRECPKRKPGGAQQASGKQSQASAKTSQTSEAMIMDSGGGSAMDNLNQEYFLEAEDIVKLDTFLAEQCGQREGGPAGLDVLHADGEEVTGDLGQSVFEFFQKQGHASGSEAYMADLATHGVPDTACRRTLIGEAVLQRMSEVLGRVGLQVLFVRERHEFKFGNAGLIQTDRAAIIPVRLGSRQLAIKAAVLPGSGSEAPLLLSKEISAMSYPSTDVEMQGANNFVQTPLIAGLIAEVQPQLEAQDQVELSASILDQLSDHEEDAPEGLVPGLTGRIIFNVGKYQKAGAAVNFATSYLTDKSYVAWVRKFVKSGPDAAGKSSHPTMTQFRLYVALRDQRKSQRIQRGSEPEPALTTPSRTTRAVTAMNLGASPKAKSSPKPKPSPTTRRTVTSSRSRQSADRADVTELETEHAETPWLLMPHPEETRMSCTESERRRQLLMSQIEALHLELERLNEDFESGVCVVQGGMDVLLLEGSEKLSMITAVGLECETCSALSRPKSHNVTKMRRATEFNQQVCIDTFELDVRHAKVHFLNIVDEATGFQMCTPLWKGMQARHVRNAYRKSWKRWAGPPVRLFCDGGKEFEGEFEHGLSLDGTFSDASAAYAPWQNGLVERKGAVWKAAYSKAQMETYPRSKQETQELIDQVNNAVNSMSRVEGFSPFQHVFGRDLRVPGMISSDYDPVINSSLAQGESVFERRMELRKAARRAFLDADAENKLRKAMEHRNRPERGPFSEGQLVYFWRKSRFETRHHWHGPAVVIGKSGSSKVWVAKGTKVYRCCPEQLRSLSPEQEAMIRLLPADMVHVRNEVSAKGAGNFYDLSMLDKPPDSHVEERSEQDERENAVAAPPMDLVSGHENAIASPPMQLESSPDQAVELAVLPEQRPRREDPRDDDAGDVSPSKKQRVEPEVTPLTRAMRASTELLDHGRRLSARAESSQRPSEIPVPEDDEDDLEVIVVEGQDHWVIDHSQSRLVRVHVVERCVPWSPSDHELPVRVEDVELVCQSVMYTRSGERHTRDYEWRNVMHESSTGVGKWTGQTVFQLKPGWSRQSASSIECFEVGATKKGRKEVIESELSQNQQAGLKKAKLKEWNKLLKSGAIVVHTGRKAAQLRKSVPRKRVLKSRFVVTEAEQGSHPDTCDLKARWCIRGYLDPDVLELDTSAPTLSAEGFAVAMQLIASHGWQLTIADVEGAFLRGDNLSPQRGRLFIDMPPGGIEGYDDQCLVEAIKTVYGLADAPKAWWNCFSGKLKDLNMQMSEFDPCVFYYYHSGRLEGVITLHVDDLCMGGSLKFQQSVQQPLRQMFPFKHWKTQQGEFLGKWLEQQSDGSIKISQEQYASSAKGIEISKERRREKSELVDESERQQMRAALGGINWLVSGSRPDLAAWCSLMQQRVNCACVSDLIEVNKLLSLARDHSKSYIWVKPIPVDSVQFSVLTDAAWANAQDHCSQAGYMIAACDSRLSAGLAEARWVRSMWCEAICESYALHEDLAFSVKVPITAVIDCKPVFDHAKSSTVSIKDKRMAIEMLLLKKDISKYGISLRWMATSQMIVDVLTKRGAPMALFRQVLKVSFTILGYLEEARWKGEDVAGALRLGGSLPGRPRLDPQLRAALGGNDLPSSAKLHVSAVKGTPRLPSQTAAPVGVEDSRDKDDSRWGTNSWSGSSWRSDARRGPAAEPAAKGGSGEGRGRSASVNLTALEASTG
ncbi:TY1B-PL [Symbiodinium natans]|uniref:TY1B-PL protein n=1 Tax=Symbiodinium natans TaxID=878477 RepID=A0A812UAW4_9DINO|nr:TY1B-PL [Symbiodinium natans]